MSNQTKPAPPKIVVAPDGCKDYLTAGNSYEVIGLWDDFDEQYGYGFTILNDIGNEIDCMELDCCFLFNQDWIIAEREVSHD